MSDFFLAGRGLPWWLPAASVYANLKIPDDLFINLFAIARIVGWTTNLMEQYQENILIRPLQEYTGPKNRKYPRRKEK